MSSAPIVLWLLSALAGGGAFGGMIAVLAMRKSSHRGSKALIEAARRREREQIARELHDTLLQGLYALTLNVHVLAQQLPKQDPMRSRVERAIELADALARDGRDRLIGLGHSSVASQFADNLVTRGRTIADMGGISFSSARSGQPFDLPRQACHELTRIAGEALMNVIRHAKAKAVELHVAYCDHGLSLIVSDDGCGMEALVARSDSREHIGVATMKERARSIGADLGFASGPNGGTRVELWFPRASEANAPGRLPAPKRTWARPPRRKPERVVPASPAASHTAS